jgi:hypothetical protein
MPELKTSMYMYVLFDDLMDDYMVEPNKYLCLWIHEI